MGLWSNSVFECPEEARVERTKQARGDIDDHQRRVQDPHDLMNI